MAEKKLKSNTKKTISIELDIELLEDLDKRARSNFMSLREQVTDIIRRSMINYTKPSKPREEPEVEDFVNMFSKRKRGKKTKN